MFSLKGPTLVFTQLIILVVLLVCENFWFMKLGYRENLLFNHVVEGYLISNISPPSALCVTMHALSEIHCFDMETVCFENCVANSCDPPWPGGRASIEWNWPLMFPFGCATWEFSAFVKFCLAGFALPLPNRCQLQPGCIRKGRMQGLVIKRSKACHIVFLTTLKFCQVTKGNHCPFCCS